MAAGINTFYFDGDCGFCQWSAGKLEKLMGAGPSTTERPALTVRPAWASGRAETPERIAQEISDHAVYVDGAGELWLGHKAIGRCLSDHGAYRIARLAGTVLGMRVLSPAFAGIYKVIALNRHRLGPLVGEQACRIN